MEDPHTALIIPLLLFISGLLSLFDQALGLCRKSRLQKETRPGYRSLLKALEYQQVIKLACQLWISILRISAAVLAGINVTRFFDNGSFTAAVIAAAMLVLILVLFDVLAKIIAYKTPENAAAAILPLVKILSLPFRPFNSVFMRFTASLQSGGNGITEDELRHALIEGEKSGIVESKERTMVEGVFYLGDRPVGAFMTHRSEVQWLDCNAQYGEIRAKALENRAQRCFPVVDGSPDEIIGTVYLEDIILDYTQEKPLGLRAIMKKAHFVPETMSALKAFESFKQGQANFLFVMDEYGGLAGIVSITALVEEIVGELSAPQQNEDCMTRQEDETWLADGSLNIDDVVETLSLSGLPDDGDFHTLAGFVLSLAGELPCVGDSFPYQGYLFKVVGMDGNRIDKLLISKIEQG
ncbi:MAG: hemolysin family protein [Treponema sp.]|jgi:putative hemolysin|nr:hemolysin family protein [Treponema sp.]